MVSMRPKSTGRDLPPRMLRRTKLLKSGKLWVGYYYNGRDDEGKRKEFPLGTDLNTAKRKWAELECVAAPIDTSTMHHIFDRYILEILPGKARNTQLDNLGSIKQLRSGFDNAPIDGITPQHIARYRDARSAKVRANREITLLSHIFNMAREWGFTAKENPCRGVRKNKEEPRDYYADQEVWDAVYSMAAVELQDAMDLNYLTGQRPADVLKMTEADIKNGALEVRQGKTKKYLRIILDDNGVRSKLGHLIDKIRARPRKIYSQFLIATPEGQPLNRWTLRLRFDTARKDAAEKAAADGAHGLAAKIKKFQFRDIRPKAASEIESLLEASNLLGHTELEITEKVYRRIGQAVKPTR